MFSNNQYINNITVSIIMFLFITSTIIAIPVAIYQYSKNGFIGFKRTLIIYLFILYLQTIYMLAIMPLPSIEYIKNNPKDIFEFINLIPFKFVSDIKLEFKNVVNVLHIIKLPSFYEVMFNIFMFIPLGVFLKNYFNLPFKKIITIGFLGSLFIELTQLSGLYFIYPRAYRIFDVDDLIINTTGAVVGYVLSPLFRFMFPSKVEDLIKREEKNKIVKILPQYLMILVDVVIVHFTAFSLSIIMNLLDWGFNLNLNTNMTTEIIFVLTSIYLLIIKPLYNNNFQTPSMKIMKYDMYMINESKFYFIIRNFIIYSLALGFNSFLTSIFHIYYIILIIKNKRHNFVDEKFQIKYLKYFED